MKIFAAFASLVLLNAIIFLGNFSLCKMLIFLCPWISPISLICKLFTLLKQTYYNFYIVIFTSMNTFFLYRLSSRLCCLSLCSTVAAVSICFGFISLYANWPLSPEWTISLGTLLGINLHVISKETLLDELLKGSFDRVTTLRS